MAAPKKSAAKKSAAKAAAKKTAKKSTAKTTSAARAGATAGAAGRSAEEPSMRSAAAKAREAASDVSVVVTSKVKQVLRNLDMRTDSDLVHEVNRRVQEMLTSAAERAKANKRSTVRPHDL